MTRALGITALLALGTTTALAEPTLVLAHEPGPRKLHMRPKPRAAQASLPDAVSNLASSVKRAIMPAAPPARTAPTSRIDELDGLRDIRQPVSFTVNVGYQIDGSRPSGQASLDGRMPNVNSTDFEQLRSYGFGEGYASTRGVGVASLSTYFSARFEAVRRFSATDPATGNQVTVAPPIATWFDRSGTDIRTGWAELKDFLPRRWGLRKVRLRAGDQFVYGAWSMHVLGVNVAYEGETLTLQLFAGTRRSDYTRALGNSQPQAVGGTLRFDLRGLARPVPLVASASVLGLTDSDDTGQPSTRSTLLQADWRPGRDVVVLGQARFLDGSSANQRLEVRARYKEVTNLVFDVTHRTEDDWRWDPTLVARRQDDITEARRYLDLGPVLPQVIASARGGTLIAENVDLFARIAGAVDLTDEATTQLNTYNASYFELGGAFEVRVRRQISIGASALSRTTKRHIEHSIEDTMAVTDALPTSSELGEEGFTEVGSTLRMTLGARKFSSAVEIYGRRTRFAAVYHDPIDPIVNYDVRGGGRFTVDAWLGPRVRLFAAYDASSELDNAPEINGYKSLKLIVSGVY